MNLSSSRIDLPEASARPAIRFGELVLDYRELRQRVAVAASALRAAGIGRGDTVAILSENRPETLILYHAAARIGAIFVSINTSLAAAEVRYIVDHSEAAILLHDEAMRETAAAAAEASKLRPIDLLGSGNGPISSTGDSEPGDFMIVYTSGTTGTPKAVVFDQAAERRGNQALIELWEITSDDRMLVALPLGFLYGLSTASATGLQAGCEVVLLPRFSPSNVLETLVKRKATIFHGVPTMFAMLLSYCEQNNLNIDLSFMRLLICAGAPLSQALKTRFEERFGKRIDDYYALTEIRPVFGRSPSDRSAVPAGAIGKAAPGANIRIVDSLERDVEPGSDGEILVRAAATMLRYHKDPALTERALRGGYFKTGDVGRHDADGYYYVTGRIKDIIIRGGANIAPAEVEDVLLRHPSVTGAAVLGKQDAIYGEVPVAVLVTNGDIPADDPSIVDHCRRSLADFKVPVEFLTLDELPLGATGKVDKTKLRAILELSS